jgi:membrane fusion protein, multidrug efflux system
MNRLCLFPSLFLMMVPLLAQETVKVKAGRLQRAMKLPGELLPYQSVGIYARVNGYVEKVMVDRGSFVQAGQTLAILSAPELKSVIAEADAKRQQALAQVAEAEAQLTDSQTTLDRIVQASKTPGAVAAIELDSAKARLEAAKAAVSARKSVVKAAEVQVQTQKEMEAYLVVKAPFAGTISERLAHPGSLVGPAAGTVGELFKLEQTSRLRLLVPVPEAELGKVPRGSVISFTVPTFPAETFRGTVGRISPSLDQKTRTLNVEVDVANPKLRLSPGMYPEIDWQPIKSGSAFLVPASAVFSTTERTFVIRKKNNTAEYVNVRRGQKDGDVTEVFGNLKIDDEVLKRATDEIRPGTALK